MELAARVPATLACPAPAAVSRTDTQVIERARRPRTEEVRAVSPPARPVRRRGRALAYVGAAIGATLLAWATLRGPSGDLPVAPATAQAAMEPPGVAVVPDETEPSARAQRQQQTLTARAPTAPASEERHRRRSRAERRVPARVALPEVFRTPGF
jgi:hypothetical protein